MCSGCVRRHCRKKTAYIVFMKKLLGIIVLGLLFCNVGFGDEKGEYAIEDIVLFDSLLMYFDINEIEEKKKNGFIYPNKDFYSATFSSSKFNVYEKVQFHLKANDTKYLIYAISGNNYFKDNVKDCYKEMKKVTSDLKSLFDKPKIIKLGSKKLSSDKSSKVKTTVINLKNTEHVEAAIVIQCYDYSKKSEKNKGKVDKLLISIDSKEFGDWLNYKA